LVIYLAGIDEAGRGAVLGPLVICCAWISREKKTILKDLGVRDSKELSPLAREEIFEDLIRELNGIRLIAVEPREINSLMNAGLNLNSIELLKFHEILKDVPAKIIYIDCFTRDIRKFKESFRKYKKRIIALNRADKRIPIVGAASIIAKVTRDRIIRFLHKKYGDFGSGYPSDERTISFLKENKEILEDKTLVRREWITIKRIEELSKIKSLLDFL